MRILIIEDEQKVSALVKRGLTAERYAVDVTVDGIEGLEYFEAFPYDLLILDLMLPRLPGTEVLQRIRRKNDHVPILVLTAKDSIDDKVRLFELGADDYLTKPFEFRELLARLRALLRRSGELRPEKITIGDLVLDTGAQTAKRAGRSVTLTAKEYALLEYLARNAGRVVRRAEIAEHVWDETFDPFSNLIEVYINRVRRKIDADAPKPLLHTRRGVGYVLGAEADLPDADASEESASSRSRMRTPSSVRKSHG